MLDWLLLHGQGRHPIMLHPFLSQKLFLLDFLLVPQHLEFQLAQDGIRVGKRLIRGRRRWFSGSTAKEDTNNTYHD